MRFKEPLLVKDVAKLIKADFDGNPEQLITGVNEIHNVQKGDLTFVDHPKYYKRSVKSEATTILINKKIERPHEKVLIFTKDPFRDFNFIVNKYINIKQAEKSISKTALIGENTIIQPNSFIGNNVIIGDNCTIHPGVSIYHDCQIGNNVIIHANTVIGADAFYYKRRKTGYDKLSSCGRVIIENNVEIGASCTIDRGVSGDTFIGAGTKMDNLIQIGHDTVIGKNCLLASQVGIAGCVVLEDDVVLWGQVGVQKDLIIGKGAIILGQSGIGKSVEGNKIYFGSPVREAKEKMKELVYIKRLPELFLNNK